MKMANIEKELRDIKNAVYGREVRGSIHDGIKKINDESENSKQKADEAHDVMESIINDGFDNAALEANFEQKLDDKIANLQPEWTGFKEDVTTQLADEVQKRENEITYLRIQKADKSYVDEQLINLDGLQFKGAFNTLIDLNSAYPDGTSGLLIVKEDNHWYYWNGNEWSKGNELTTIPWNDYMYENGDVI